VTGRCPREKTSVVADSRLRPLAGSVHAVIDRAHDGGRIVLIVSRTAVGVAGRGQ